MLDIGIKDMRSNYNEHRFSKLLILGIGMLTTQRFSYLYFLI